MEANMSQINSIESWGSRLAVSSPMSTGKCQNQNSGCWKLTKQRMFGI